MPKASAPIHVSGSSRTRIIGFIIRVTDLAGSPLQDRNISLEIEGHGSLDSNQLRKRAIVSTGREGAIAVRWFTTRSETSDDEDQVATLIASYEDPFSEISVTEATRTSVPEPS